MCAVKPRQWLIELQIEGSRVSFSNVLTLTDPCRTKDPVSAIFTDEISTGNDDMT